MPIYEYHCAKCGKTIEVIQKMSDRPLKKHERCGGTLTKLISAAGFQFKGTGWYVTDYARKSSGESKETSADKKTESKETSSNGSKEGIGSGPAGASKAEGTKGKSDKGSSSKSSSKKD